MSTWTLPSYTLGPQADPDLDLIIGRTPEQERIRELGRRVKAGWGIEHPNESERASE